MSFPWALASCLLTTLLAAQTAGVVGYGTGCAATIGWNGLPRLGQTVTFTYNGPNSYFDTHGVLSQSRPVFLLGISDQQMSGLPLPFVLPTSMTNGLAGCTMLQSSEVLHVMPWDYPNITRYVDWVATPIPNDPALLGGVFFAQWLVWQRSRRSWYDPFVDWIRTSDAAKATVGI